MKKLILLLFTVIIAFTNVHADENVGTITFKSNLNIGDSISLCLQSYNDSPEIDIQGASGPIYEEQWITLKLTSQEVKIIGNVSYFASADNRITDVDVSQMPQLKTLDLFRNPLEKLNISNNKKLTFLDVAFSNLKQEDIDLSLMPNLQTLNVSGLNINSLDTSKNPNLLMLFCYRNDLKEMDFTNNKIIFIIHCFNNMLEGEALSRTIATLPITKGDNNSKIYIVNTTDKKYVDRNVVLKSHVKEAAERKWDCYDWHSSKAELYEGAETGAVDDITGTGIKITMKNKVLYIESEKAIDEMQLIDYTGRLVMNKVLMPGSCQTVDINGIADGVYILKIGNVIKKISIK